MKNLLLILALFVGNSFAEDEYPIELTCEVGAETMYLNIEKKAEDTWIKFPPVNSRNPNLFSKTLNLKKGKIFIRKFRNFEITEKNIFLAIPIGISDILLFINRSNGKITIAGYSMTGECFKGFKEYKERKF